MLIILSKTITYSDWLPALLLAVFIMAVAFFGFVFLRKEPADGKFGRADAIAMVVMLLLSTIGVYSLLRLVV